MDAPVPERISWAPEIERGDTLERTLRDKVEAQKELFFDYLKDGENGRIIRCLSPGRNARNWSQYIDEKDVAALYSIGGKFGRIIRSTFHSITLPGPRLPPEYSRERDGEAIIKDINLARKIVDRGDANFKSLNLYHSFGNHSERTRMVNEMATKLSNVQSISNHSGADDEIFKTLGKGLKKLELNFPRSREIVLAIPTYCRELRELSFSMVRIALLKDSNVWKTIGKTLEKLSFSSETGVREEINNIEKYCRRLEVIDINIYDGGSEEERTAVTKCLASYKEQLESARISYLSVQQLKDVVWSCTRAQFKMQFRGYNLCYPLMFVGKQLESVSFEGDGGQDTSPGWKQCPNLQKVIVSKNTKLADIQPLLQSWPSSLKSLELSFNNGPDIKAVADAIGAAQVTSLESVSFEGPLPPANAFKMLAERSRSLRVVYINPINPASFRPVEKHALSGIIVEFVECFLQSPDLEFLRVGNLPSRDMERIDAVDELLRTKYRHRRGVHVSISQYFYA